jgi:hypothetical protein
MRTRTVALAVAAVLVQALGSVTPAHAADPVTQTFTYTGLEQTFLVPDDVDVLHVVVVGGKGGGGASFGGVGGFGHRVIGDVSVEAGTTLYLAVAGNGLNGVNTTGFAAGGAPVFNGGAAGGSISAPSGSASAGGGSGGGASDIRTISRGSAGTLDSRLVVAGGGGGGSGLASSGVPGNGGNAGSNGTPPPPFETAGGAGTATSGGAGGIGASSGSFGNGGAAANVTTAFAGVAGGGGGGGGYFGGGGAGAGSGNPGGGGGGSSFTGSATSTSVTVDTSGVPSIAITYTVGEPGGDPGSGTVNAVVTMASAAVCLELSTTSIDFGTRRFGEVGAPSSPLIGVSNCGGIGEVILVRGTNATGPNASAWSLVDVGACQTGVLGTDKFRLRLESQAIPDVFVDLTTENDTLGALGAGSTVQHEAQIDTPCPGSTGAGEVMSMQIVFTAIEQAAP